jgi:PIN domain nuclease of toxin-antitoxin system
MDDGQLSERACEIIRDGRNDVIVSAASVRRKRWSTLAIDTRHVITAAALPDLHRDPFDRALIAQAQVESLPLLTTNAAIARYDVETIW